MSRHPPAGGDPRAVVPGLSEVDGRWLFDGRPLRRLAEPLETPCFLFSARRIEASYRALADGIAAAGRPPVLRYCAKTNFEATILERLAGLGSHLLASHAAEVELARACGFAAERIAYQRPVLEAAELDRAMDAGIDLFHAHRAADLATLGAAAARRRRTLRVSLRLRPPAGLAAGPLGWLNRRVGFAWDELPAAAAAVAGDSGLALYAVNVYLGTQQSSPRRFTSLLDGLLARLAEVERRTGVRLAEVNLGGGVPSPGLRRLTIAGLPARLLDRPGPAGAPGADPSGDALFRFGGALAAAFHRAAERAGLSTPPTLALEPGRAIVGEAGLLLGRVRAVEGRWIFLDAGRKELGESSLFLPRRLVPLWDGASGRRVHHLSGPTLDTLDVVDLWRRLPTPAPGALLAIGDAGAYSLSRASRYATTPAAAWLLTEDGATVRIRRPEGWRDLAAAMDPDGAPSGRGEGGRLAGAAGGG